MELWHLWLWLTITLVLTIVGIVLSCIMIHVLRKKQPRKAYETCLLSLSVGEIIMVPLQVIIVACFAKISAYDYTLLIFTNSSILISKMLSLHHLIIISADRMWAVTAPMNHIIHATGKKLTAAISFCWISSIIITVSYIGYVLAIKLDQIIMAKTMTRIVAIVILVADGIFFVFYGTIIAVVYRKQSLLGNAKDYQIRVLCLCMGTVIIFVLSSTPYVVVNVTDWKAPIWLVLLSSSMLPVNSIATSVLFLYQNSQAKKKNPKTGMQIVNETLSSTNL